VPFTNPDASFMVQAIGVISIGSFVIVASTTAWLVLKHTVGIRASEEDEMRGLDQSELGMEAYPEFGRGSQTG
jgi:Amt family ammonium transporter